MQVYQGNSSSSFKVSCECKCSIVFSQLSVIKLTIMDIRTIVLLAVTLLGGGAGERGGVPGEEILFLPKFFVKILFNICRCKNDLTT